MDLVCMFLARVLRIWHHDWCLRRKGALNQSGISETIVFLVYFGGSHRLGLYDRWKFTLHADGEQIVPSCRYRLNLCLEHFTKTNGLDETGIFDYTRAAQWHIGSVPCTLFLRRAGAEDKQDFALQARA